MIISNDMNSDYNFLGQVHVLARGHMKPSLHWLENESAAHKIIDNFNLTTIHYNHIALVPPNFHENLQPTKSWQA